MSMTESEIQAHSESVRRMYDTTHEALEVYGPTPIPGNAAYAELIASTVCHGVITRGLPTGIGDLAQFIASALGHQITGEAWNDGTLTLTFRPYDVPEQS